MAKLSVDQALLKAKSHAKKGEIAEAKKIYSTILNSYPKNIRAKEGLAALSKIMQEKPAGTSFQNAINSLLKKFNVGEFEATFDMATRLSKQFPNAFQIWHILGITSAQLTRFSIAHDAFDKAILLNPKFADAYNNKAVVLKEIGELEEALILCEKAIELNSTFADAYNVKGVILQLQKKFDKSVDAFTQAIKFDPKFSKAYNNLGISLFHIGKVFQSIDAYNNAIKYAPYFAGAYFNKGISLRFLENDDEALEAFKEACNLKSDYFEAHKNIGDLLRDRNQEKLAFEAYDQALEINPQCADAWNGKGNIYRDLGQKENALKAFKAAIELEPDNGAAHLNSSYLKKYTINDPQLNLVKKLICGADQSKENLCLLYYTYGKMCEDTNNLDLAFQSYKVAGEIRRESLGYEFKNDQTLFEKIKFHHNKVKKSRPKIEGLLKATPIFILGMPRSGTTLVEQILSSHSQISAAGEAPYLIKQGAPISIGYTNVTEEIIMKFRDNYLQNIVQHAAGMPFVTDKTPHNFLHIGLICKAFPEAKIIHVMRDPAATCWSNFKNHFRSKALGYSCDIQNTVDYFLLYKDLMSFWTKSYRNKIYNLNYEHLTSEQNIETNKLIEYLGLDWEEACLSPHKNPRIIKTVSNDQVRKKVYKGSSSQWKKFKPYLVDVFDDLYSQSAPLLN